MDLFKIGKTDTKLCCSCQRNEENVASVLGLFTCLNSLGHFISIYDSKGI